MKLKNLNLKNEIEVDKNEIEVDKNEIELYKNEIELYKSEIHFSKREIEVKTLYKLENCYNNINNNSKVYT